MSKSKVKFKETIIGKIPEKLKVSDLFILLLPTAFDAAGSFIFKIKGVRFIYSLTPDCV